MLLIFLDAIASLDWGYESEELLKPLFCLLPLHCTVAKIGPLAIGQ